MRKKSKTTIQKTSPSKLAEPYLWQELRPFPVIGVDEVGRGCLAGHVYAGAVILTCDDDFSVYTDSKLLSASRREELAGVIRERHRCGIGFASVEEIAELNILQAALLAMRRAVESLGTTEGHVLVDGNQKIPGIGLPQTALVKGDLRASPVAAASILAKVVRDRYMCEIGESYPQYGFAKHKGYGTPEHRLAIEKHGPCSVHRSTFAGVKEYLR